MKTKNLLSVIILIYIICGCNSTSNNPNESSNIEVDSNTIVKLQKKTMEIPSTFQQIDEDNPNSYHIKYKFQSKDDFIKLNISETKDLAYAKLLPRFPLKGQIEIDENESLDSLIIGERKIYIKSSETGDTLNYRYIFELDGEVININFKGLLDKKDFIQTCGNDMVKSIK